MHLPYTDSPTEVATIASQCVAATLTAVLWSRPLRTSTTTGVFSAAIWLAILVPVTPDVVRYFNLSSNPVATQLTTAAAVLQQSATLATLAALFSGPRWFAALAASGQLALLGLALYLRESDHELMFAYLLWYGALVGVNALRTAPRVTGPSPASRTLALQDGVIFLATIVLAAIVCQRVFGRVVYNGDEIANTFQADVYGHLRAYAPVPPCRTMFFNFWVFQYKGRAFSQYTPGWPLFMAAFQRLGVIWLAGPVMAGIAAVGIARLSRRCAMDLGTTPEQSRMIVLTAGPLGAVLAMLGPSMLLNGASRFSHTMVVGCFVWAVESLCVLSGPSPSPKSDWLNGFLLGAATSLGLATRPADGGTLGVGIFLYFLWAFGRRRIGWRAFLGTTLGFALFGGLTLIVLRLQLGQWFKTGYSITNVIHPGTTLTLSWPKPQEVKYGIPLATGSYMWWPAAPALGLAGLVHALGGRERRVAFMLAVGALALISFYFFVEFGRGSDDGLGPRYELPLVVPMAVGGAGILAPLLAPLLARIGKKAWRPSFGRSSLIPAALVVLAAAYGIYRIRPRTYPVAHEEHWHATGPMRGARQQRLKNAIVIVEPGKVPADDWNVAQNAPMDPNPDVLFLIRKNAADETCAKKHFPGRTWYRAGMSDKIVPY